MNGEYKPPKTRKKLNLEEQAQGNVNVRLGCGVSLIRIQIIGGLQCLVEFTTMSLRQS